MSKKPSVARGKREMKKRSRRESQRGKFHQLILGLLSLIQTLVLLLLGEIGM